MPAAEKIDLMALSTSAMAETELLLREKPLVPFCFIRGSKQVSLEHPE